MVLCILNQEKIRRGYCLRSIRNYLTGSSADFAREFQLNRNKRVLLVLDQAGWHTTDKLELPEGLDLYFLPSHSPELQPAERLWPLTNEVIANNSPHSLKELEELLIVRCRKLLQQQELVRGLTCYHWWPLTRAI